MADMNSMQIANVLADALRDHGLAVMFKNKEGKNGRKVSLDVTDPTALIGNRKVITLAPDGDAERASAWTEAIDRLEVSLTALEGRDAASAFCGACRETLADVLRERGEETVRDAYLAAHPNSKLGQFINPLMTFNDMLMGKAPFERLINVQDSSLHVDVFNIASERYGIAPFDVALRATTGQPLILQRYIKELESGGALLNESTNKLAISWLPFDDSEIIVFDCTAEGLANITLNALKEGLSAGLSEYDAAGDLYCQNFSSNGAFVGEYKICSSIQELAESGFFRCTDGSELTNASTSRDLLAIIQTELGICPSDVMWEFRDESGEEEVNTSDLKDLAEKCGLASSAEETKGNSVEAHITTR